MRTIRKTLIVSTEKRFALNRNGKIINEDNTRSNSFWERYLKVFDKVIVVARVSKKLETDNRNYVENDNIKVYSLSNYQGMVQGILNYFKLRSEINSLIQNHTADSYLLRVPGAVGYELGALLIQHKLKYSLEIVGDPFEVYITQRNILYKALAYKERQNFINLVNNAESVAYVTQFSLQKKYPFKGKFQTYYSSIKLQDIFFAHTKKFHSKSLLMVGVGNVEMPYKGVSILLQALKFLDESQIDFKMTWIGDGKYISEYKDFVAKNKLTEKIDFLGSIPNEEIPLHLQNNNIFILPSLTEGLPRSLIEAMASRLICLGSAVGGIPELLDSNCIFPSNDSQAIVAKLKDVHLNFSNYTKYSEINFNKALEYLPEVLEERRFKFLNSIPKN